MDLESQEDAEQLAQPLNPVLKPEKAQSDLLTNMQSSQEELETPESPPHDSNERSDVFRAFAREQAVVKIIPMDASTTARMLGKSKKIGMYFNSISGHKSTFWSI